MSKFEPGEISNAAMALNTLQGGSQETGAESELHGMQGEIKLFVDSDEEFPQIFRIET